MIRKILRRMISSAANLTPNVVYYASGWPAKVNGKLVDFKSHDQDGRTAMSVAAIAMSCAAHEALPNIGDTATITLTGVTRGKEDVGHFLVTVARIREQEAVQ